MRRHARAILAAAIVALAVPAARARPPVWVVKSPHATAILFGSLHVLPPALDWIPPRLTEGLARSDELWFELPMDAATQARVGELARARGLFAAGDHLTAHLAPDEADRLAKDATALGLVPASLEPVRPWLADVILSLALDAKSGASSAYGVETRIQTLAPVKARRQAFETADEQVDILAGAADADQAASLDSTLDDIESGDDRYQRMLKAWMAGDIAQLRRDVLDPVRKKAPALYARMITDRNNRWTARLRERLDHDGTVVVVVGMGHLIGPEGVPAQLRAAGFAVEGP